MEQKLIMRHLGPINCCELSIKEFTVFTGPQSNGKSTIAKAVYFFKSVKQDILQIMMQGGPKAVSGKDAADWRWVLERQMRNKFLQLFGTSWVMPDDMFLEYTYSKAFTLNVYLTPSKTEGENYIKFWFSPAFEDYLRDLDHQIFTNVTWNQKEHFEEDLIRKLDDPYETVYIPAGRNLITLLSTQLNYIFTALEDSQLRNIDYVTKRYTELILKLKPQFEKGVQGFWDSAKADFECAKKSTKHQPALNLMLNRIESVMKGTYRCVEGEERLYLDAKKYIKINFASSGQQEIVWVLNLLFYYLVEDKRVFLILEEPESHLYPDSQQTIGEVLSLFKNESNAALITTHSPYLLGTFNYLLLAGQVSPAMRERAKKVMNKRYWLNAEQVSAYYISGGTMANAINTEDELLLIDNGLIDGASEHINELSDQFIELMYNEEHGDE